MTLKIERELKKNKQNLALKMAQNVMNKAAKNNKKTIQNSLQQEKNTFFCKNILLYTTNNRSKVVEIFVC